MAGAIRGITIEFDSDTSKLSKGIKNIEQESRSLQTQINALNKQLKLDPGNIELSAQKMDSIAQAAAAASSEVEDLKRVQQQMDASGEVDKTSSVYRQLEREIALAESKAKSFQQSFEDSFETAPVEQLDRQIELLKEDIEAGDKAVEKMEAELSQMKANGVDQTSEKYKSLSEKIEAAKAKNEILKQNLDKLNNAKAAREAADDVEELGDAMDDAADSAEDAGTAMQEVSGGMSDVQSVLVTAGLVKATKELANALKDVVGTTANFQSAMSQVAATMGTSVDSISSLTEAAKEMGSKTQYSATESAEALNYLALSGMSAEEAVETLPTVLNLAAAGSMSLSVAADQVTDAMSALGLGTENTSDFVDQLAKTASSSNTSVSQLGEAILTIGATGKSAAGGTTELNTELALLANNGIKGSEGGTKLRNIFLSLQSPTEAATEALAAYTNGVYDSEGKMRNLGDVFGELKESLAGMEDVDRDNVISTIFNKTDLAAAKTLLEAAGDQWESLAETIEDSGGAAEKMANTQLDNLNGSITELESATEGLKIAFGEQLTPAMQGVTDMATEVVSGLTGLVSECSAVGPIVTGIGVAMGTLTAATAAYVAIEKVRQALKASEAFMNMLTPIGLVSAAIGGLVAVAGATVNAFKEVKEAQALAKSDSTKAAEAYEATAASVDTNNERVASLVGRLNELTSATEVSAAQQAEAKGIVDELNSLVPDLGLAYDEATNSINMNTDAIIRNAKAAGVQEEITALEEQITALSKEQREAYEEVTAAEEDLAESKRELAQAQSDYDAAIANGEKNLLDYQDAVNDAQAAVDQDADALERTQGLYDWYGEQINDTAAQVAELTGELQDNTDTQEENAEVTEETVAAQAEMSEEAQKAHDAIVEVGDACEKATGSGDDLMAEYESLAKTFEENADACDDDTRALVELQLKQLQLTATTKQLAEQMPLVSKYAGNMANALVATGTSVETFVGWYSTALDSLVGGFDKLEVNSEHSLDAWVSSMNQRTQIQSTWNENIAKLTECVTDANTHPYLSASEEFRTAVQTMMDGGVEEYGQAASDLAQAIKDGNSEAVWGVISGVNEASAAALETSRQQFMMENNLTSEALEAMLKNGQATIEGNAYVLSDALEQSTSDAAGGVESGADDVATATSTMMEEAAAAASESGAAEAFSTLGETLGSNIGIGITAKATTVSTAAKNAAIRASNVAKPTAKTYGKQVGEWFGDGFALGIESKESKITTAAKNAAKAAYNAAYKELEMGSPSKAMYEQGEWYGEGYANGILASAPKVAAAATTMAEAAAVAIDSPAQTAAAQSAAMVSDGVQSALLSVNANNSTNNAGVVNAINGLKSDIAQLKTAMSGLKVYLNGKTLVGSIAGDMDMALGARARGAR